MSQEKYKDLVGKRVVVELLHPTDGFQLISGLLTRVDQDFLDLDDSTRQFTFPTKSIISVVQEPQIQTQPDHEALTLGKEVRLHFETRVYQGVVDSSPPRGGVWLKDSRVYRRGDEFLFLIDTGDRIWVNLEGLLYVGPSQP